MLLIWSKLKSCCLVKSSPLTTLLFSALTLQNTNVFPFSWNLFSSLKEKQKNVFVKHECPPMAIFSKTVILIFDLDFGINPLPHNATF